MKQTSTETISDHAGTDADEDSISADGDVSRRIVLATGISLDKRELYEVSKAMSLDWDLRRLSLLGPVLWNFFVLAIVVGGTIAVATQFRTLLGWATTASAALGGTPQSTLISGARTVITYGVPIGVALLVLAPVGVILLRFVQRKVTKMTGEARSSAETLAKSLLLFNLDTWKNANYWHPFTSHHSDRDPLVLFANSDGDIPVSGVYTDIPYYRNVFVDSVYVTLENAGNRERELAWFERRFRRPRRYVMGVLAIVGGSYLVATQIFGVDFGATAALIGDASNGAFLIAVLSVFLTSHFQFHSEFYANTAGAADYDTLLHENPQKMLRNENRYADTTLLGNSLAGYGIFYVSEFFRSVVAADRPYECRIANEDEGKGHDALVAGKDVVKASLPGPGTEGIEHDATPVKVNIHGVKHLRQDDEYERSRLGRLQAWIAGEGDKPEEAYMNVAGTPRGIRLPVKRYMSVPFGPTSSDNRATEDGNEGFPAYFYDGWDEDEVHYLLVGGAEHQQGLVKFVQYLKNQGYENVDLVENTFASASDYKFTSEYFVSSVLGGPDKDVFRGDSSFLYLRHRHESGHYLHAVIGLSAKASKMGSLYWRDQFPTFDGIEDDVLYHVSYETDGVDDVGDYYVDADVSDDGISQLDFSWETDTNASDGRVEQKTDTRIGCQLATLSVTDVSE